MRNIDELRRNPKVQLLHVADIFCQGYITLSTGAKGSVVVGFVEGGNVEHVSVQLFRKRLPTWEEMCEVKEIFWEDDEEAIQIHPKKSEYVNLVEALHLWAPVDGDWNRLMKEGR